MVLGAPAARAAGPPLVDAVWSSEVRASSARLSAEITPSGSFTEYHFDYLTDAAYSANLGAGREGFFGAGRVPAAGQVALGAGTTAIPVSQLLGSLNPGTAYRYRVVANNAFGTSPSTPRLLRTFEIFVADPSCSNQTFRTTSAAARLPDCRAYEMVSPVDKNGGQVEPPGAIAAGGLLQAAAEGSTATFDSRASIGAEAKGAPLGSQYIARRGAAGWATEDISTPMVSGSYGTELEGVPYRLFSGDLARGLLLNGRHCRGEGAGCPVANPPLPGSGAPPGYQNYYLRESADGGFTPLLTAADLLFLPPPAADFGLALAGASSDLHHVVLSSCAALSAAAVEVPQGEGCDASQPNLYEWSGSGLSLINVLPGETEGTPGAALAAQSSAISADGSRVYWRDLEDGNLYLREGGQTKRVDVAAGGGGEFQTASTDGSLAFYAKAGHLYRYDATGAGSSIDLTPSGGLQGVLGASQSGAYVYYLTADGLFLWRGGTPIEIASGADAGDYPPDTGTARVSADGTRLAFVATAPLLGYDNTDLADGQPDSQVYLYDATGPGLACISCNPTNERPSGPSTIPGSIANGAGPQAPDSYKPRALTAGGRRLFFNSADALTSGDKNSAPDVYEWEAPGTGSCAGAGGCLALVSSGESEDGASFADASASGSDAFFLTGRSLVGTDPGSVDLYDAREGGGFPEPVKPIPCEGDSCQVLPSAPVDPSLNTLITGAGNPAVHYHRRKRRHRTHRPHRGKHPHGTRHGKKHGRGGRR
jgi:hypothetical protein